MSPSTLPARLLAIALVLASLTTAVAASAGTVRGRWTMTVVRSSNVVRDTAGAADITLRGSFTTVPGAVGDAVNFNYAGRPALGTARASQTFNPGRATFAVAAYLKTGALPRAGGYSPNVVQKGLFTGHQWKMQLKPSPRGTIASCRFQGSAGADTVDDRLQTRLNDGRWHEVVCWRRPGRFGITVDGANSRRLGSLGLISTGRPLTVGNKTSTAGVQDQFTGTLDCVAFVKGNGASALAARRVPC